MIRIYELSYDVVPSGDLKYNIYFAAKFFVESVVRF